MAITGSYSTSTGVEFNLIAYYSYTQSVSDNTSSVTVTLKLQHNKISATALSGSYLSVAGNKVTYSKTISQSSYGVNETTLATKTVTVKHNDAGEGSCTIKAAFVLNGTYSGKYIGTLALDKTLTLQDIPRSSSFTMASSVNTGSALAITIKPSSSTFKHKIRFEIDGTSKYTSGFIAAGTTSYSYTIPHSWLPSSTSATMKVFLYTYTSSATSDTDYIARINKSITVNVPSNIKPVINSVSPSIVSGLSGKYVQGKSKVQFTISATAGSGSSIKLYAFSGANLSGTSTASSKTSDILQSSGTLTYSFYVKDGRRQSDTVKNSIYVYPYSDPQIVSIKAQRCLSDGTLDRNGTYAKVTVKTKHSSVGGANNATVVLSSSLDSYANTKQIISSTTDTNTYSDTYMGGFNIDSAYTIKATITDQYGQHELSVPLEVAKRTLNIAKYGNGLAIGGLSTVKNATDSGLFECNWETKFAEGVNIDNSTIEYLTITHRNVSDDIDQDGTNETVDIRSQLYVGDTGDVTCRRRYKTSDATDFTTQGYWQLGDSRMYVSYPLYVNGAITTNTQFGSTSTYSDSNFNIYCQWKDGNNHDLIVRNSDGLSMAIGWVGTSSNITTLDIRPKIASARGELFTNAKTDAYDGKQGICVSNNGRIYLVGTVSEASGAISPYSSGIVFAYNRSTSGTSSILETAQGVLTVSGTLKATVDSSSDERMKKDFNNLEKFEGFYNDLSPCCFKMKSNDERYHIGFVAQQVEQSLKNNGLTKDDFGALNISPYEGDMDESSKDCIGRYIDTGIEQGEDAYGLVYSEFIALNTHMIQKLQNTVQEQQKEIDALKAEIDNMKTNN